MDATRLADEPMVGAHPKHLTDLLWHVGTFVITCSSLWILDAVTGAEGVRWAPWTALFWAVGLALHGLAWMLVDRPLSRGRPRSHIRRDVALPEWATEQGRAS